MHAEEGIPWDAKSRQDDINVEGTQSEHRETSPTNARNQQSTAQEASLQARQRRRIAQLEEKLEVLESGRAVKEKQANYYAAQGRAIRRVVALFDNVEDLIAENDRRYEDDNNNHTIDQDRLQIGYVTLSTTLPWFCKKVTDMEYDEYLQMLKLLRQGADSARGDNTSKLKTLVAEWVNKGFKPDAPVDFDDKHTRGFSNDVCGRLLCPAQLDWNNPGYIVTDLSFPAYLYDGYTANLDDLEEGLFRGKILVQGYKAVFTSPSSAKDIRFSLSSITSWWSIDGDFDYCQFWCTIVDFFERPPGRDARRRVDRLLEWWSRCVIYIFQQASPKLCCLGRFSDGATIMTSAT
ncbi:hypothetical protein EDD22DRAFT_789199 [Suillus occidentalis]|nr:hypothetical protein EDD22DRAFT_789199 [Suillus occidentalis]